MTDELKLNAETARAARAQAIMTDPLVVEAFDGLHKGLISRWIACNNIAEREAIWQEMNALVRFRATFAEALATGNAAAKMLDGLRQAALRAEHYGLRRGAA